MKTPNNDTGLMPGSQAVVHLAFFLLILFSAWNNNNKQVPETKENSPIEYSDIEDKKGGKNKTSVCEN